MALEEIRYAALHSLSIGQYQKPSGLCLECFNRPEEEEGECELCRVYEQKTKQRFVISDANASWEKEKPTESRVQQEGQERRQEEVAPTAPIAPTAPRALHHQLKSEFEVGYTSSPLRVPDARAVAQRGRRRSKQALRNERQKKETSE